MTHTTNFDTSSTGVNLELSISYDSDLAQTYFENWLCDAVQVKDGLFIVGDYDAPFFSPSRLNKMKKAELVDLCYELEVTHNGENYTKAELVEDLMCITISDYYKERVTWGDYSEVIEHAYTRVNGHRQGDAVLVISADNMALDGEHLARLFYDAPISAVLTIDDEVSDPLYIDQHLADLYEYDRDDVLKIVADNVEHPKKETIMQWLAANLPAEYLDYA